MCVRIKLRFLCEILKLFYLYRNSFLFITPIYILIFRYRIKLIFVFIFLVQKYVQLKIIMIDLLPILESLNILMIVNQIQNMIYIKLLLLTLEDKMYINFYVKYSHNT